MQRERQAEITDRKARPAQRRLRDRQIGRATVRECHGTGLVRSNPDVAERDRRRIQGELSRLNAFAVHRHRGDELLVVAEGNRLGGLAHDRGRKYGAELDYLARAKSHGNGYASELKILVEPVD